jgi:hypothetical protein
MAVFTSFLYRYQYVAKIPLTYEEDESIWRKETEVLMAMLQSFRGTDVMIENYILW